ncbi:spermatogenesis-associated protein 17-like [Rhincodon typus]|uniref:spermatogenesis-associated protein 17-like n=1 Tax=Rhincodon typus TaxID=259920 RepID=UPI00202E13DC|nr:spermatogenesis-associated protein 17-like [Rhincodon typus]
MCPQPILFFSIAEENRFREHCAAVKIQSCFRGFKVRAHIRYVQKVAIIIQKTWRGYRSRMDFRTMVQRAYFIMKMNFYNEMAVRVNKSPSLFNKRWHQNVL